MSVCWPIQIKNVNDAVNKNEKVDERRKINSMLDFIGSPMAKYSMNFRLIWFGLVKCHFSLNSNFDIQ